jgi:hypothetical protein
MQEPDAEDTVVRPGGLPENMIADIRLPAWRVGVQATFCGGVSGRRPANCLPRRFF